jgi:hypothetical protein
MYLVDLPLYQCLMIAGCLAGVLVLGVLIVIGLVVWLGGGAGRRGEKRR